jgi:hypothetical protein
MATIDVFSNSAFNSISLTTAINKAPFKPRLLGSLNLFEQKSIRTTTALVEERQGKLSVLPISARGSQNAVSSAAKRKARNFEVPHVPYFQTVMANDIQNLRAFGSESELEAVAGYVNDQLVGMRDDHEATHEWHRMGALKGIVLDSDGTTEVYDYFEEFGITQNTSDFDFSSGSIRSVATDVIRQIAGALGNTTFGQIVAVCGNTYFDRMIAHTDVKDAFDRWQNGEFRRASLIGPEWYGLAANGFMYQNIFFLNYRGAVDALTFLADTVAYYFPTGVSGLFQEIVAPADFMETANTPGQLIYAKQEPLRFNKGVELHTQSNALYINTRPAAVIKSTFQE